MVALRATDLAGDGPPGALEGVHADGRREQRGAYDAPDAGALPLVQGGQHAVGAVHPRQQVGDRDPDPLRVVGPEPVSDISPASPWAIWS